VAADSYQSMARRSDASVATWGYNAYGQLGDGTTTDSWVPKNVPALAGATAIAAGPNNGLALRADGSAVGWGWNGTGAVGDATTTDRLSPTAVSGYNRGNAPLAAYAYDGSGLRTKKAVAGMTTNFTWESSSGLPLLIDDGTNYYLYGPDGLPLEHIDRNGAVTWYHHDQLGSTRTLSNSAGATVATATYDAYGRLTASTGKPSPLGFAGEYADAETGFVYLRARYYDPATGQFLSRDPLVALTGSAYAYVDGNPLNGTDPSGLAQQGAVPPTPISSVGALSRQNAACSADPAYSGRGMTAADWIVTVLAAGALVAIIFAAEILAALAAKAGLGTSLGPTGRTVAENLKEQLAMEMVVANPAGSQVRNVIMSDPRWLAADGGVKRCSRSSTV